MTTPYAHDEALVDTRWVVYHLNAPEVRLVEVDDDVLLYDQGHIPSAVKLDWGGEVLTMLRREWVDRDAFAALCARLGITNETTVVFYGDRHNCYAAYAYWFFRWYGHQDVRLLNGGRAAWEAEGRVYTRAVPTVPATRYHRQRVRHAIRADAQRVHAGLGNQRTVVVDVRDPVEFMSQPGTSATGRTGHIPTACNIPWEQTLAVDGTFLPATALAALYQRHQVTADQEIITYCCLGERSAHTWFVLTELLGYAGVSNYDGSWTEWSTLVGAPIAHSP